MIIKTLRNGEKIKGKSRENDSKNANRVVKEFYWRCTGVPSAHTQARTVFQKYAHSGIITSQRTGWGSFSKVCNR